eukprot:TRINITY_DN2891_c0_g1_i1.p1 TRINITY_DN2891_c0_g1~~TRINITY_DN2891_c0_g1_i1.p1  ORF type:complete len:439 (+),score=136.95 TRINITY_DN2891_c0_g1_i1:219-1535(+)
MADAENATAASKKRMASKQLSRDDDFDAEDDSSAQEMGTFKRATDEVLAKRRIVKVKRNAPDASSGGTKNPFAAIKLVPTSTTEVTSNKVESPKGVEEENKDNETKDSCESGRGNRDDSGNKLINNSDATDATGNGNNGEDNKRSEPQPTAESKDNGEGNNNESTTTKKETLETREKQNQSKESKLAKEETLAKQNESKETKVEEESGKATINEGTDTGASGSVSSFQQLSSTPNAFAGVSGPGFLTSQFSFGTMPKSGDVKTVSFGPSSANKEGSVPVFGSTNTDNPLSKGPSVQTLQDMPLETGEETEKAVFTAADTSLYEFISGKWKERGKGEIKVNVSSSGPRKARLIMRSKGNYRLILNASLFPDMKLTSMDKRGISFACMNSAGESKTLSTFALKFKDTSMVEEFCRIVDENKGKASGNLKTPENSPKAPEE